MSNNYFIKNMEEKISRGDFTYFLSLEEAKKLSLICKKKKITYSIYKPYQDAEKVIFYKKRKPSISIYEIKAKNILSHADILGTLYAHSIKKEMYGDILIEDKVFIILFTEIEKYITSSIDKIRGQKVIWKKAKFSEIESFSPSFDIVEIKVTSNRVDTILSRLLHISRNNISKKIEEKKVMVNEKIVTKGTVSLKEKDIFSVRGYGKYKYEKEIKKDKIYITLKKYK